MRTHSTDTILPVWGTKVSVVRRGVLTRSEVSRRKAVDCHIQTSSRCSSTRQQLDYSSESSLLLTLLWQTFDTNWSIAAKGKSFDVPLESHVASIMMLVPNESTNYHFRNFAIIGSSNGPRNSIVVPGALALTLTSMYDPGVSR